jgi:hypothetical protein
LRTIALLMVNSAMHQCTTVPFGAV